MNLICATTVIDKFEAVKSEHNKVCKKGRHETHVWVPIKKLFIFFCFEDKNEIELKFQDKRLT